jgi:hypothetical protein
MDKHITLAAVMVNNKNEQRLNIKLLLKFKKTVTEAYREDTYTKHFQK